jgi:hypothetical protein
MDIVHIRNKVTGHEYDWPASLVAVDPDLVPTEAPPARVKNKRPKTPRVSGGTAIPAAETIEAEKEAE